ncbi:RluA family pseudouridine synthase [Roseateles sp. BYS180W]|uniref:Pseudouridine synthase n=1 Tax=Roseateles rivi TaxID=3299028 RepID=A0ABW7FVV6_9BURK
MNDYRVRASGKPAGKTGVAGMVPDADLALMPVLDDGAEDEGTPGNLETRSAQVGIDEQGLRLDKFLVGLAPEFSRSHLQALVNRGVVRVDGQVQTQASRKLRFAQRVEVELHPTEESRAFVPQAMPLDVVYEDEHLLVLCKPAGLVVHPAAGNWSGTLLNGLLAYHAAAATLPRAGIVHRLDKDTSGLMLVGKSLVAVTALVRMIAARQVHREYFALAWGEVPEALHIDAPLGRDPQSRVKMAIVGGGKPAQTDVYALGLGASEQGRALSAVRCVLHTGRTHQIRVHLASRGYPLLADHVYGGAAALGLQRQALHAMRLTLAHPIEGRALSFESPLPVDLAAACTDAGLPELVI